MKNKKKQEMPKNKYFGIIIVVLLVAFAVIGVNRILGREVSLVCEDKQGNLFVPRDKDGKMDECGKHGEAITFKFEGGTDTGTETGGTSTIGSGEVLFIDANSASVLRRDKQVWSYDDTTSTWSQIEEKILPPEVNILNVIQWNSNSLLTNDGSYYSFIDGVWVELNVPTIAL